MFASYEGRSFLDADDDRAGFPPGEDRARQDRANRGEEHPHDRRPPSGKAREASDHGQPAQQRSLGNPDAGQRAHTNQPGTADGDTQGGRSKRSCQGECHRNVRQRGACARRAFVNITREVEAWLKESGVTEGLVLVNAMYVTASVFIHDDERGLHQDYDKWLEDLAPHEPVSQYQHNRTSEDNADAHMKRQIMGREVVVAITKVGPWEQISYGEFDGRRHKRALDKIIGE